MKLRTSPFHERLLQFLSLSNQQKSIHPVFKQYFLLPPGRRPSLHLACWSERSLERRAAFASVAPATLLMPLIVLLSDPKTLYPLATFGNKEKWWTSPRTLGIKKLRGVR